MNNDTPNKMNHLRFSVLMTSEWEAVTQINSLMLISKKAIVDENYYNFCRLSRPSSFEIFILIK